MTPRATVTSALGDPAGTVQFELDGEDLGVPQPVAGDGTASHPALPVSAGTHRVTAEYLPSNKVRFAGSSDEVALVVAKAATTTTLSTGRDWIKTVVAPVAPGAGTPSGDVEFFIDGDSVGTAGLSEGTAQLAHSVPAGEHVVSSNYLGDDSFLGSVASTSRKDPVITAVVSSAGPSRAGWYRSPVTIRYTCTPGSAPLAGPCPSAVTVSDQGGSTLSRTIEATDGGLAMVSTVVNIDSTRPSVQVTGVRAGGRYFATGPKVQCSASDPLSGVDSCTVKHKRHARGKVTVTATATDRAGNRATVKKSFVVVRYAVAGASWSKGAWTVRKGQTYTLLAQGAARPRYVYAAPRRPHGGNVPFVKAGHHRWALGATMSMTTRGTRVWHLGIKDHSGLHILKVRVIG